MTNCKILVVDDSINILTFFKRGLESQYDVTICENPQKALTLLQEMGPFAVVVSDMHMPQMSGIQFLAQVRKLAPDTIRVMSTGVKDFAIVVDAINDDHIYRFLPKPVSMPMLTQVMSGCVDQYFLRYAEKQLLEMTLHRSIKMLTDILALARPAAYGRASRLRRLAADIARQLGVQDVWQVEIAAMLSQIGAVAQPDEIVERLVPGAELTVQEKQVFARISQVGHDLVANIPRLETVALSILYQEKSFDGSGSPDDEISGESIPLTSRILKAAMDLDNLMARGATRQAALVDLSKRAGFYDPNVLDALIRVISAQAGECQRALGIAELEPQMILDDEIQSKDGESLVKKGQELTPALLHRLKELAIYSGIREPIQVRVEK